jgi:hypothetical protein
MDRHSMLSIPLRTFVDVDLETTDRRERTLCYDLVFPNTIFNCFSTLAQCFSASPTRPRTTLLTAWGMTVLRPDDMSEG